MHPPPRSAALGRVGRGRPRREDLPACLPQLSYEEVAEALGIPRGTAGSRPNRARKKLRKIIGGGVPARGAGPRALPGLPFQATDLLADPDRALAKIRQDAETFVRSDQRRRGETDLGEEEINTRVEKVVARGWPRTRSPPPRSGPRSSARCRSCRP
ncbi:RNA polymerase sigma factor [Nonomuraea diastatica]|uniref:RNA polymerase sigma factor n=1 Tax=Nonomuraea diastatica TaxID=1848329 RepID=UPI00319E89BC